MSASAASKNKLQDIHGGTLVEELAEVVDSTMRQVTAHDSSGSMAWLKTIRALCRGRTEEKPMNMPPYEGLEEMRDAVCRHTQQ